MTRREDLTLLISAITLTVVALLVITLEAQFSPTTATSGAYGCLQSATGR